MPDDNYPYVQYDSWNYLLDINEENQMAALNVSAQLGNKIKRARESDRIREKGNIGE